MGRMIKMADASETGAVSSRRTGTAQAFWQDHDVQNAFDAWGKMGTGTMGTFPISRQFLTLIGNRRAGFSVTR